jgi:hypothetical protein
VDQLCVEWRQGLKEVQNLSMYLSMYDYYKSQEINKNVSNEIETDIKRADLSNTDFKIDPKSGDNALYNILKAYANFDPEIGYS